MDRAAVAIAFATAGSKEFGFGFFGLGEGEFGGDGEVGIELGIEPVDASKQELGEFGGGNFALTEELSNLLDRGKGEIRVRHGHILSLLRTFHATVC